MVVRLLGKRLLVVNDQAADPSTLTPMVESWSVHLHVVASGAEALALLRHGEVFEATY
jgi:CheY-like chemotaxis protein